MTFCTRSAHGDGWTCGCVAVWLVTPSFIGLVGDLTLDYEVLELPADPGLELVTYSAAAGSASETALGELANWARTREAFASNASAGG